MIDKELINKNIETRNNYFKIIGDSPDHILHIPNFVNNHDLNIIMEYINSLPETDEEFYGPLDIRIERIKKDRPDISIIIKKYEEKTFEYIDDHFIKQLIFCLISVRIIRSSRLNYNCQLLLSTRAKYHQQSHQQKKDTS